MRIAVFEFVCGGGWPGETIPASLAREGKAMWSAVVSDLCQIPDVQVVSTWDVRLGVPPVGHPQLDVLKVAMSGTGLNLLLQNSGGADCGLVIAPETGGQLIDCCRRFREQGIPLWNCEEQELRLCGDKLALWAHCRQRGISTIDTTPLREAPYPPPVVVKLRDGAGSQEMQLVRDEGVWQSVRRRQDVDRFIAQPYIPGRALSLGVIFRHGELVRCFPLTEQILSTDGHFTYQGGRSPAQGADHDGSLQLVKRLARTLTFHGYVGFDLLQPDAQPGELLLVEINPRLTTSIVGYRALFGPEWLNVLVRDDAQLSASELGRVEFTADGRIAGGEPSVQ